MASAEVRAADIDEETIHAAARGFAAGFDAEIERDGSLPLTIPVEAIVAGALRHLREIGEGLDRDEAYLLSRLEASPRRVRTRTLREAINEAPSDDEPPAGDDAAFGDFDWHGIAAYLGEVGYGEWSSKIAANVAAWEPFRRFLDGHR